MLLALGGVAAANPVTLRMAGIAPEGTSWARELKAFAIDVETRTHGEVRMKWILGGIAGGELEALDRIKRGQLDGEGGSMFCQQLAPSLRVLRTVGLFQSRDEFRSVVARLRPRVEEELTQKGFVGLGVASFGSAILMSREPIRSLADWRKGRTMNWDLDQVGGMAMEAIGIKLVPLPLEGVARAYDEGRIDNLPAVPSGALAYQWSSRAKYFTELPLGVLPGCVVVSSRAFQALGFEQQQALRSAGAKFTVRFEEMGRAQDEQLLSGLFEKQGMKRVPVSETFRAEFFAASRNARDELGDKPFPRELGNQVTQWLADYRAEHGAPAP
jgi:TRAP-type C4-dicarboxylate transport system substrate-binding protein